MELYYAFLKNNRVEQVAVFAQEDKTFADIITAELGYDTAIWVGEKKPAMWAIYDGKVFTPPTTEYLISIGVMNPIIEAIDPEVPTE